MRTELTGHPDSDPAALCEGVLKIYPSPAGDVLALKGVDATFPTASVTAIVGPSGSGKSSLLRILACFDQPTTGRVRLGDTEVGSTRPSHLRRLRRRHIGYVFQRPADNLISYLPLQEQLRLASHIRSVRRGWRPQAERLLQLLGLAGRRAHLPGQLSGGEQQRAAFATALMGSPTLVIADEPTAELDRATGASLMRHVGALADLGTAFVIATHDPMVVASADRTYHLRHGSIEAESTRDRPLSVIDATGRIQLPQSWRSLFPDARARVEVEGDHVRIDPP